MKYCCDNWIPCSDRLPETSGRYLVSRTDYDGFNDRIIHLVEIFEINIENKYDTEYFKIEVDAWQPLPTEYEGE